MDDLQRTLVRYAIDKHKKIHPCGDKTNFNECFTNTGKRLLFWYNTEDHSTHLITYSFQDHVIS